MTERWEKEERRRRCVAAKIGLVQREDGGSDVGKEGQLKRCEEEWPAAPQSGQTSESAAPIQKRNDWSDLEKPEQSWDRMQRHSRGRRSSELLSLGGTMPKTRFGPASAMASVTTLV